jgi:BASS family bile acid:Na+ symporter
MDIVAVATQVFAIALLVVLFTIGLRTDPRDLFVLARRPSQMVRALVALFVLVPTAVIVCLLLLDTPRPINAAFIALAVSPMLPALPTKTASFGADHGYVMSLAVVAALSSVVAAPLVFSVVSRIADIDIDLATGPLLLALAKGLLLPFGVGAIVHAVTPAGAVRLADVLWRIALPVVLVSVLIVLWDRRELVLAQVDARVLLMIVAFVAIGLAAGHLLGGPERGNQTALALTAASRHVGFALAIVKAIFPEGLAAASGAIVLYFLLRPFLVLPYTRIRRS